MKYNKFAIAAGLLVGVAVVAGILRLKFYFDPPQDNFNEKINEALARIKVPDDDTLIADTAIGSLLQTQITPQTDTTVAYSVLSTTDLGSGLALAAAATDTGTLLVVLDGSQLVARQYDHDWALLEDHTLFSDVALIGGEPPVASIGRTADGYHLLLSQLHEDTVDLLWLQYDLDFNLVTTNTLQTGLPTSTVLNLVVGDKTLWVFADLKLTSYNLTDSSIVSTVTLSDDQLPPCALVSDQAAVVTITATDSLELIKYSSLGIAADPIQVTQDFSGQVCQTAQRRNDTVALVLLDEVRLFSDNFVYQYPTLTFDSDLFYPQVLLAEDGLAVLSSSHAVLGEYQLQVSRFGLAAD